MKRLIRVNGTPMFLLAIEQRVTAEQIAGALAFSLMEPDGDTMVDMTETRAERIVRQALFQYGQELDVRNEASEEWTEEQAGHYERMYQLALRWVYEHYPVLKPAGHAD